MDNTIGKIALLTSKAPITTPGKMLRTYSTTAPIARANQTSRCICTRLTQKTVTDMDSILAGPGHLGKVPYLAIGQLKIIELFTCLHVAILFILEIPGSMIQTQSFSAGGIKYNRTNLCIG